jgi:uncharacterized protein with beta-barrel porin domain
MCKLQPAPQQGSHDGSTSESQLKNAATKQRTQQLGGHPHPARAATSTAHWKLQISETTTRIVPLQWDNNAHGTSTVSPQLCAQVGYNSI